MKPFQNTIQNEIIKHWLNWQGAICCDATNKTWLADELINLSESLAMHLQQMNAMPGDIIALALSNTVALPIFFMACLLIDTHPLLLNVGITQDELDNLQEKIDIKYFLHDFPKNITRLNNGNCNTHYKYSIDSIIVELITFSNKFDGKTLRLKQSCILQPSSGTSGSPKICVRTPQSIVSEAKNYVNSIPQYNKIRIRILTNLNHAYAFGFGLISSLITHSTLVISMNFNPKRILRQESEVTSDILALVPAMMMPLIYLKNTNSVYSLPTTTFTSGTNCDPSLAARFEKLFKTKLYTNYGTTETGAISSNAMNDASVSNVGRTLRNVHLQLRNMHKYDDLGTNIGEIWVKSPSMMYGYINEPPLSKTYFFTGDLGSYDKNCNLKIVGRIRDIINVNGVKINPSIIESIVLKHPAVVDCAAYSGQSKLGDEIALVAIQCESSLDVANIKAHCYKNLNTNFMPQGFYIMDKIPRTASGKCLRYTLPHYKKV